MENKDSLNTNKVEIKKDRGDNLKRVVKPIKAVHKKDLETTKDLVADRGDSAPKPVTEKLIYPKNSKPIETLNANVGKKSKDLVSDRSKKLVSRSTKHNEGVKSKNLDKTVLIKLKGPKQNEPISISSDKFAAPANLITYKDSVLKPIKDKVITKNTKQSDITSTSSNNTALRNSKRNEEISKITEISAPALISDRYSLSKPIKVNVIPKKAKHHVEVNKSLDKTDPSNLKQNEEISFGKLVKDSVSKPIKDKVFSKYGKDNIGKENNNDFEKPENIKPIEATIKNFEKFVPVLRKNIVESEKLVNRLHVEEKKRLREKYTFKLKAFDKNKRLEDKSDAKGSQFEDNNDNSTKGNNEAEIKEKTSENTKSENTKIEIVPDPEDKSRKRPIIRTIVAKNDATKVYKAVTFAEQKRKSNTLFQIQIPVLLKKSNTPNGPVTENNQLPIPNNDENEKIRNMKNPKISQINEVNMTKNMKKPKISPSTDDHLLKSTKISTLSQKTNDPLNRNVKNPKIPQSNEDDLNGNAKKTKISRNYDKLLRNIGIPSEAVMRNTKIPTDTVMRNTKISGDILSKNNKVPKLQNTSDSLKRYRKMPKMSHSSESRSSVKTKISKKEKRNRLKSQLSHYSFVTGSGSPTTEVAKWAPNSINKHTQPYYEAWVDTTLAAISRTTKKDKEYYESQKLVKTFKNLLQKQGNESPDLMYENYLDERYAGKIKINNKK